MPIDERELRSRLAETAELAGPPRLSEEDLAARVRRSRRRRTRAAIVTAASAVAVALAVAIPLTRGQTGQPVISMPASGGRQPAISAPYAGGPAPSYAVTVNGQTLVHPAPGGSTSPLVTIAPGERVTMTVQVTVPGPPWAITALWLGITNGILSAPPDGPGDMSPVLAASTRVPLRHGTHRFVLHWTVPAGLRPGSTRQLSARWNESGPEPGGAEGIVAEFAVPQPSAAGSPATVAHRLRTTALHGVVACNGTRPAWILAVRTTFGRAIAAIGGGNDIADNANDAVYLVLMKGDFTLSGGGPARSTCVPHQPAGQYYSAIYDAATFVTLEAGVGSRPLPVPPRTLGPVLNLT